MAEMAAMQYILIIILASFAATNTIAQTYSETDSIVKRYGGKFWSPEKLADRINGDFSNDSIKARAIYTWIATYVGYDTRKYQLMQKRKYRDRLKARSRSFNITEYRKGVAKATLRRRLGVCGEYSILFHRLCELTNVSCEIVIGNAKTTPEEIGRFPMGTDHAWNVVNINGRWRLVDATWGAGYVERETMKFVRSFDSTFFFTPPDLFFRHHFARDKRWLLIDGNDSAFAALPLYHSLRQDIVLIKPLHGVVAIKSKDGVSFEFNGNGEHRWSYFYHKGKEKWQQYPDVTVDGNNIRFLVPGSVRANDFLTICCDGSSLVTFKIRSRKFLRTPFAGGVGNNLARN